MKELVTKARSLEYSRPTRVRRHRFRLLFVIASGLLVAFIAYLGREAWLAPICDRVRLLQVQRECRIFGLASDVVVYDDDALRVRKLRATANYEYGTYFRYANDPYVIFHAPCLQGLDHWVRRDPAAYETEYGGASDGATVFLHERKTQHGERRLVYVECFKHGGQGAHEYEEAFLLRAATLESMGVTGKPIWQYGRAQFRFHHFGYIRRDDNCSERVFAGQPDVNDPSRFSIRCMYGTTVWRIDGRLEDTGTGPVVNLVPIGMPGPSW